MRVTRRVKIGAGVASGVLVLVIGTSVVLAGEKDRVRTLELIAEHLRPGQRIFVGVTDPIDPLVESAEEVRDRVLEAATVLPVDRLGTTDDCGFSPFADDTSTSRDVAFDKITAGRGDPTRVRTARPLTRTPPGFGRPAILIR